MILSFTASWEVAVWSEYRNYHVTKALCSQENVVSVVRGENWERSCEKKLTGLEEERKRRILQARTGVPLGVCSSSKVYGPGDAGMALLWAEPRKAKVLREEWCLGGDGGRARLRIVGWQEDGHIPVWTHDCQQEGAPHWCPSSGSTLKSWHYLMAHRGGICPCAQRLLQPIQRDSLRQELGN